MTDREKVKKEFENWQTKQPYIIDLDSAWDAWEYQQKKIDQLAEKIEGLTYLIDHGKEYTLDVERQLALEKEKVSKVERQVSRLVEMLDIHQEMAERYRERIAELEENNGS